MGLEHPPVCWIVAGPNGAGKTTFALDYLPRVAGCRIFVNADLIAAGLAPLAPEGKAITASRLFLREIRRHEYVHLVDGAVCLCNAEAVPVLVFTQRGTHREVADPETLRTLEERRNR